MLGEVHWQTVNIKWNNLIDYNMEYIDPNYIMYFHSNNAMLQVGLVHFLQNL